MLYATIIFMLGIAYRIRGGGWLTFGSTFLSRLYWCVCLAVAFGILTLKHGNTYMLEATAPLAFVGLLIPHAYCMNMGLWPFPQKRWPSFFMPTLSSETWAKMSLPLRALYDGAQMASVNFLRGLLLCGAAYGFGVATLPTSAIALATLSLGHPVAYALGYLVPFSLSSSLRAKTAEWGELFTGIIWGISFIILTKGI
jgi:hypothetical protein